MYVTDAATFAVTGSRHSSDFTDTCISEDGRSSTAGRYRLDRRINGLVSEGNSRIGESGRKEDIEEDRCHYDD